MPKPLNDSCILLGPDHRLSDGPSPGPENLPTDFPKTRPANPGLKFLAVKKDKIKALVIKQSFYRSIKYHRLAGVDLKQPIPDPRLR
jgi:hypothetical protein